LSRLTHDGSIDGTAVGLSEGVTVGNVDGLTDNEGVSDGPCVGILELDGNAVGDCDGAGDSLGELLGSPRIGIHISKNEHVHFDGVPG